MDDILNFNKKNFSKFNLLNSENEIERNNFLKSSSEKEVLNKDSLTSLYDFSFEDSGTFLNNLLRGKENIINENWEVNENIQGKILSYDDNEVYVDCLLDKENTIIQSRRFPISLFKNLSQIDKNKPVLIKTRLKAGAIRIDVYSGEGIVNLKIFESNEQWDSLKGKNLDSKLTEW